MSDSHRAKLRARVEAGEPLTREEKTELVAALDDADRLDSKDPSPAPAATKREQQRRETERRDVEMTIVFHELTTSSGFAESPERRRAALFEDRRQFSERMPRIILQADMPGERVATPLEPLHAVEKLREWYESNSIEAAFRAISRAINHLEAARTARASNEVTGLPDPTELRRLLAEARRSYDSR